MKIGRNDSCPCGSGKKYKKCCIDKILNVKTSNQSKKCDCPNCGGKMNYVGSFPPTNNSHPFSAIGAIRPPRGKYFNKKINDLYLKGETLYYGRRETEALDYYLKVTNYLIDFAIKKNIKTFKKLDECGIIEELVGNIFQDFEIIILNSKERLKELLDYVDRLIVNFDMEDEDYLGTIRVKSDLLFKLKKHDDGEKIILDYLEDHPKATYAYIELIDNFRHAGNYKKAKYYYDKAMSIKDLEDKDVIEERMDDWYKEV